MSYQIPIIIHSLVVLSKRSGYDPPAILLLCDVMKKNGNLFLNVLS